MVTAQYLPVRSLTYPERRRRPYPISSPNPATIPTTEALAPRRARYCPLMLRAPSYVMSAKRLTTPTRTTNLSAESVFIIPLPPKEKCGSFRGCQCANLITQRGLHALRIHQQVQPLSHASHVDIGVEKGIHRASLPSRNGDPDPRRLQHPPVVFPVADGDHLPGIQLPHVLLLLQVVIRPGEDMEDARQPVHFGSDHAERVGGHDMNFQGLREDNQPFFDAIQQLAVHSQGPREIGHQVVGPNRSESRDLQFQHGRLHVSATPDPLENALHLEDQGDDRFDEGV